MALILAGLLLGLLMAVHWQGPPPATTEAPAGRARAAEALRQSEQEQEQLKETIARLREELAVAQLQASQQTGQLADVRAALEQEQVLAGLVPVQGPGVVVTLDDSSKAPVGPGANIEDYIIHEYDLRDVVNLLWNGGAEAISINNERLVNTTSIYCVGSTIMVNDTRLSPPYEIRAIGPRQPLEALLSDPANLTLLRPRIKSYGVKFAVSWAETVDIPAYSGTFRLRYARSGEVQP